MQQRFFYMMRLYLLLLVILLMSVIPAYADGEDVGELLNISTGGMSSSAIRLEVNDHMVATEGGTKMINGRAMVPLKIITDTLGIPATFGDSGQIKIDDVVGTILLKVGDIQAKVNDQVVQLDAAPVIQNGQTLVPLRFIAETLQAKVEWVANQNLIKIHRNALENVTFERYQDVTRIIFDITVPDNYKVFILHNPERLVVDFAGATYPGKKTDLLVNTSLVSHVRASQFQLDPAITRAVIDLVDPAVTYQVQPLAAQRRLVLDIARKGSPSVIGKTSTSTPVGNPGSTAGPTKPGATTIPLPATPGSTTPQPTKPGQTVSPTPAQTPILINTQAVRNKLIVIDPGHGGKNPGAIGVTGTWESNINYDIASRLNELLQNAGAFTIMTRKSDEDPGLWDRPGMANNSHADLFISIHSDSHPSPATRGSTVYAHYNATKDNWSLAWFVHNEIIKMTGLESKGLRAANFVVLREAKMPAILVESAYMTNKDDEALLKNPDFRQLMAQAIFNGIVEYYDKNK